ncbi:hypothetical protein HYU21_02775 [Candidatus Woesearchaeota archaeon]|nr:hypothetical protein [Candidatus Woesearchaeota archaeon]
MEKRWMLLILFVLVALGLAGYVSATGCWDYTSETNCESSSDAFTCEWKTSPWGSWCEEKTCWNAFSQSSCIQSDNSSSSLFINKTCQWTSNSYSWCTEVDCWAFDGTTEAACESNGLGIQCNWNDNWCMGPPEKQCWSYSTESTCEAITGCGWGSCMRKSCNDYTTSSTCTAGTGYDGGACKWNAQYNYCQESGCWDLTDITTCNTNNDCKWNGGYCSKKSCWDNSYTNSTACVNNSAGLSCQWNSPYCEEKNCWSYNTENTCTTANSSSGRSCKWNTYSGGSCEEKGCWSWDSWKGGTEASCRGNGTALKLGCTWNNDTSTPANTTDGWCFKDISTKSCANWNGEQDCMSSFYCLWNQTSSLCQDPVTGAGGIQTDFIPWYPGCYLFDYQGQSACENVTGCTWSGSDPVNPCRGNATINNTDSTIGGIRCNYINSSNNSDMCTSMSQLPFCCSSQGGTYCEDYNSYTDQALCNQIASNPWYMPCKWNNASERCEFKADQIFEEGKESLVYLDSKQTCEAAGGKWITDSYCNSMD